MTRLFKMMALAVVLAVSSGPRVGAQDKPPAAPRSSGVPLKVQLVISRLQGEKKISSVPFTISVIAEDRDAQLARLRIGASVPIPTQAIPTPATPVEGKPALPTAAFQSIQYRDIGTNIDCTARTVGDGRFHLQISIDQSSVLMDGQSNQAPLKVTAGPMFRSFRLTNAAILRDGETTQFTTATDAVTGEIVRVDVTVNVVK